MCQLQRTTINSASITFWFGEQRRNPLSKWLSELDFRESSEPKLLRFADQFSFTNVMALWGGFWGVGMC